MEYGSAADTLECGIHGHLRVQYANGQSRLVRGAFMPERRPFSGLKDTIPASACQVSAVTELRVPIILVQIAELPQGETPGGRCRIPVLCSPAMHASWLREAFRLLAYLHMHACVRAIAIHLR